MTSSLQKTSIDVACQSAEIYLVKTDDLALFFATKLIFDDVILAKTCCWRIIEVILAKPIVNVARHFAKHLFRGTMLMCWWCRHREMGSWHHLCRFYRWHHPHEFWLLTSSSRILIGAIILADFGRWGNLGKSCLRVSQMLQILLKLQFLVKHPPTLF